VQAICTEIEAQLHRNLSRSPEHREGHRSAEWALLDFGGFVVHVFSEQARRYYDLERLWRMAPKLDIPDQPDGPSSERNIPDSPFGHEHFSGEAVSNRPQSGRSRQ
jgi:ribosome-associated protein